MEERAVPTDKDLFMKVYQMIHFSFWSRLFRFSTMSGNVFTFRLLPGARRL